MSLHDRIRDVLARLATLSEGSTSSFDPQTSHGAPSSQPPTSAGQDERASEKLYDWWRERFTRAVRDGESEFELHRLYILAEHDYAARAFPEAKRLHERFSEKVYVWACPVCPEWREVKPNVPAPICRGHWLGSTSDPSNFHPHPDARMEKVAAGDRVEQDRAQRIVELYEGMHPALVAAHEYTSEGAIRKARRMLGREPQDGTPRAEFYDWNEERRRREVAALAERGMKAPTIAHRLRIAKSTVQRYLPVEPVAA